MTAIGLDGVLAEERPNALASWGLVSVLVFVGVRALVVGSIGWATFAIVVTGLALIPPSAFRSRHVMLPWEVLLMAALPAIGLAFGSDRLTSYFAAYLAVAAVALVVSVELHAFTAVRMTAGFAVIFVVVSTLAAAAAWAVLRWTLDLTIGTTLLVDHDRVMSEFVYSALAGLGAGVIFELYFRRTVDAEDRLPESALPEVTEVDE